MLQMVLIDFLRRSSIDHAHNTTPAWVTTPYQAIRCTVTIKPMPVTSKRFSHEFSFDQKLMKR